MRIGYFINQYPAVSHSFIRREILALESLGLQVSRFAIRPDRSEVIDNADKIEAGKTLFIVKASIFEVAKIITKKVFFEPVRFFKVLLFTLRFNARYEKNIKKSLICFFEACILASWAKKQDIQHLHVHFGTNSTTIAMIAKRLGGSHYSFTVHGPEEFDKPETIGLNEKIRESRFVVGISSYGRSQLSRWADYADLQKIHIVHCGLDEAFIDFQPLAIPSKPRIVSVGRLCEQKGQLLLLQAASQLAAEGIDFKLVLVGDGPMREQIEAFITKHNLASYVELMGSLSGDGVCEQMSLARAFVLPSFAEGLPVVIMEALAMGRPVISTYVAGIPELVKDGVNGWLVPAGSVDDLVSAMRKVIQASSEELTVIGEEGRKRVLERHSIITEAKKLKKLFSASCEKE